MNMIRDDQSDQYRELTNEEERVIVHKRTELPFSGRYYKHEEEGTYTCRRCSTPLFPSTAKFDSDCGWPSFDDALDGAVKEVTDRDSMRTEVICAKCKGHLGHVFKGERFTEKNVRHCVNSISMSFVPDEKEGRAYFAGGCFWGVEYLLEKEEGVISAISGYMGGNTKDPTYKDICYRNTGHAEAVEVVFDKAKTSFEKLARVFFEIHDPTQVDRQGLDVGDQYRSEVFYVDEEQKRVTEKLIKILEDKGYKIATKVTKASPFWRAEDFHQDYYGNKGTTPYCHARQKRF